MPRKLLCGRRRAEWKITRGAGRGAALLGLAIAASGLALWVRRHGETVNYPLEHAAQFSVPG